MTNEQIKNYLEKYRIDSEESLAKHIEELKRNTIPNNDIIFPLVDMLVNEKSVLNSFFAENKKIKNPMTYLDEALENIVKKEQQIIKDWNSTSTGEGEFLVFTTLEKELASDKDLHLSTRHKSRNGEGHKASSLILDEIYTTTITVKTNSEQAKKIKEIVKEFNTQESAEKTEKEDKNFFSKCIKTNGSIVKEDEDSITIDFSKVGKKETEKEELPPYIKEYVNDYLSALSDIYEGRSKFGSPTESEELFKNIQETPLGSLPKRGKKIYYTVGKKESQTVEKAPIFTYCKVNKNALEALALRALHGHKKYEIGDDWENFTRVPNGDFEYSNSLFRHALEIGEDTEEEHLTSAAWNAVSRLEIYLRNKKPINDKPN